MPEPITIHFRLEDYFKPGGHKVAVSVPELVEQTNEFSVKNRPGCAPTWQNSEVGAMFLRYNVRCNLKESDPAGHEVRVRFDVEGVKDETTAKNLDVQAACSCPAFLWWGAQWNMHQRDALEGEPRDLLTAPSERLDLRGHFVICKHLKAVFERILPSVQHNINNVLRKQEVEKRKQREPQPKERMRQQRKPLTQLPSGPTPGYEEAPGNVITRSTPATEIEKERLPRIEPKIVPVRPNQSRSPLPTIPELDDELDNEHDLPAAQSLKPLTDQDRAATDRIERDWELEDRQPFLGPLEDEDDEEEE